MGLNFKRNYTLRYYQIMKKLWFEIFWNWWHSSVCDIALTFIWRRKYIFDKCGRTEIFFFCVRKLLPPTYLTKYPSFSYSQEVFLLILAVRSSPVDLFTAQQNHRCSYHTKTISQSNQAYFPRGLIWWKQRKQLERNILHRTFAFSPSSQSSRW